MSRAVGDQIVRNEWLGMMHVGIKRQKQGWAFLDKPDAGMTAAMYPPLMTLRLAEPPFQVQIVLWKPVDRAYEQAGRYVVEHSDALIAVWDGLPAQGRGGTAEIVAWGQGLGKAVIRVWPGVASEGL